MEKNGTKFKSVHAIFGQSIERQKEGIANVTMHTEVISKEEENQLWETNAMGLDNSKALLRAVFYLNGWNFVIRGG